MNPRPAPLGERMAAGGPERQAALDALACVITEDAARTVATLVADGWPPGEARAEALDWLVGFVGGAINRGLRVGLERAR